MWHHSGFYSVGRQVSGISTRLKRITAIAAEAGRKAFFEFRLEEDNRYRVDCFAVATVASDYDCAVVRMADGTRPLW